MFNKLFPYKLHLQIFQLDEYSQGKFLSWIGRHFFTRTIENKKPLVWTQKAKAIYALAILLAGFLIILLTMYFRFDGFLLGLFLATQAYVFLLLASYFLLPFEIYRKTKIKTQTERKIESLKKLKVIGITGSYGKTSVKEFLYQILRTEYSVLKTPNSYNTPYGIAKVVDLELDDSYEYFICEMGAYRIGEIKEICGMMNPRYGILTGINEQHLETFGSLENTTKGKFELIDSLPENGFGLVNGDNEHIKNELGIRNLPAHSSLSTEAHPSESKTGRQGQESRIKVEKNIISYGFSNEKFSLKNMQQTAEGSECTILLDGKAYEVKTRLLGRPNLQNILAAATMSFLLGMKPHAIIKAIGTLAPVPHRLEIREAETMTIIDDAYNSNVDGFTEAITLLNSFKRPTILVTPGIVDLGDKTLTIHKALGKLLDTIDYVMLIGKSERTKGLKEGMRKKERIIELESIKDAWSTIAKLPLDHPVVLLENDLPDNY